MGDGLLSNLNEQQKSAVTTTEGYVRVIAGAGSGKTNTLSKRYAYLVEELGVSSSNILCVTFTNKAAREMRKRISQLIGQDKDYGYISTYHGFCVKVLREDISRLGFPASFSILDSEDQKAVLKEAYSSLGVNAREMTYKQALRYINKQKSKRQYLPLFFRTAKQDLSLETAERIFREYLRIQAKTYSLDFNDLIVFALHLLQSFDDILSKWSNRLVYVMVDEFQDSSSRQFTLVDLLSSKHKNLFVVGDPDQTIYTWRGAKPEFLVDFDKKYDDVQTIIMDQNYRSTPSILGISNALIKKNSIRIDKELFTNKPDGAAVIYYHADSPATEADWVVNKIKEATTTGKYKLSDIAILYRAHYLSRAFEQQFITNNIDYKVYGGLRFFERKEIKDILAYLRMIAFHDDISFLRTINYPKRGLGPKFINQLRSLADETKGTLFEALQDHSYLFQNRPGVEQYLQLIQKLSIVAEKETSISDQVQSVIAETGILDELTNEADEDRLDNLRAFQESIIELEEMEELTSLEAYLQEVALYTDLDQVEHKEKDQLNMMTIHTSKGLEFPVVFLVGFIDGVIPNQRSLNEREFAALEEERRLGYVAMTRAEDVLFISDFGGFNFQGGFDNRPSRFLKEIPERSFINEANFNFKEVEIATPRRASEEFEPMNTQILMVNDIIEHPVFGRGVIEKVIENHEKFLIRFDDLKESREINSSFQGLKLLASADTSIPADWNELESDFQEDELLLDMDKSSIQDINPKKLNVSVSVLPISKHNRSESSEQDSEDSQEKFSSLKSVFSRLKGK